MSLYCSSENKLRRSKSTGALDAIEIRCDDSKCVECVVDGRHQRTTAHGEQLLNSLNRSQKEEISVLKQQIQKIAGMVREQQSLLSTLKEDPKLSSSVRKVITNLFKESLKTLEEVAVFSDDVDKMECVSSNKQAMSLLTAIEPKQLQSDNTEMMNAVSKLSTFLKIDMLRDRNSDVAMKSPVNCHNDTLPPPEPYKLNRETRNCNKTLKHVAKAVDEIEEASTLLLKSFHKPPRSPDIVWERYHYAPESSNIKDMNETLQDSREILSQRRTGPSYVTEGAYIDELNWSSSPMQPADPEVSLIDHLMQSAIISKKIDEGDFNSSFEEALSQCNLSLVMAACRAADPGVVFNPCSLSQAVLLSLVQQLTTDMVHETQLKCRYLEEAIINLDVTNQDTRTYLPFVVGEVRKHLSTFVHGYPNHIASRRIALIIMAADNLMK